MTLPPSGLKIFSASRVLCSRPRTLVLNWRWKSSSVKSSTGAKLIDAGVVDEDVDLAEGLFGFGEEALCVRCLGDIALYGNGFAALGGDVRNDLVRACLAGCIVDDDLGAGGSEVAGDLRTDALGRASNDGDLTLKLAHGAVLLCLTFR